MGVSAAAVLYLIGCTAPSARHQSRDYPTTPNPPAASATQNESLDPNPPAAAPTQPPIQFRGQNADFSNRYPPINNTDLNGASRAPMPASGQPTGAQFAQSGNGGVPYYSTNGLNSPEALPPPIPNQPRFGEELGLPPNFADINATVEEARTGRFMFGVGVNSSAGITGQITLDERNFDITRIPTSWSDITDGTAFRGAGQGFRLEALPGSQVQRYMASFTEPYLFSTPISLSLSAFYFDRNFFDWDEQRLGGRVALGYRITHDLSVSLGMRLEEVQVHNPRVRGVPELEAVLGDSEIYGPQVSLTHDTRDIPFAATEGHYIELTYQQVFGSFDYPRGDIDLRKYHLIFERPDGSGRHTFSYGFRFGFSGSQTPVYDNYFAGGFSSMRGFDFRGASPVSGGVIVGGEYQFLGTVEYTFPLTADDMLKGVLFCDYGTVEEKIEINGDDFRVAPGFGFRLFIPAMGPAPLAFDFAFPVMQEDTDQEQIFSFFIGIGRL